MFASQSFLNQSQHIACYLPFKDEFDSLLIIEAIWQAKKHCYLPVLAGKDKKSLYFVRYDYGDALHPNSYGILEPINTSRILSVDLLDVVVMPLVAFDMQGHRLGTGGGYYDRTFAFLPDQVNKKTMMIGLGYAAQQAECLPFDPWDIIMAGVVTEQGFISCS